MKFFVCFFVFKHFSLLDFKLYTLLLFFGSYPRKCKCIFMLSVLSLSTPYTPHRQYKGLGTRSLSLPPSFMGHLLLGVLTIFLTPLDIVIILYSQDLHRFNWMFASFFDLQFSCYPSRLTFLLHESTSFRIPSNESLLAGGELFVFDYLKISWFCLDYFLKIFLMWTIFF